MHTTSSARTVAKLDNYPNVHIPMIVMFIFPFLLMISRGNPMKSLVVDGKIPSNPLKPLNWCCFSPHRCSHKKALEKWPVEMLERMLPRHLQRLWFTKLPRLPWETGIVSGVLSNSQTPRCLPCFFFLLYPQVCLYKRKQDWGLVKQQLQREYLSCI